MVIGMASSYQNPNDRDAKASVLTDRAAANRAVRDSRENAEGGVRPENERAGGNRRSGRRALPIVVDALIVLVLIGIGVGAWFGYTAIKEAYAPTWEERPITYYVEMEGIDPGIVKYGQDGRPTFVHNSIWNSGSDAADLLGTVTDVQTVLVAREDGQNSLTLYLTVEANALYREGKGYRLGQTRILAGLKSEYRLAGLTAEGWIISLDDPLAEETAEDTAEITVSEQETVKIDPDAEG